MRGDAGPGVVILGGLKIGFVNQGKRSNANRKSEQPLKLKRMQLQNVMWQTVDSKPFLRDSLSRVILKEVLDPEIQQHVDSCQACLLPYLAFLSVAEDFPLCECCKIDCQVSSINFIRFFKMILFYIGIQLIYSVLLVSNVQHVESVTQYLFFFRFFSHMGHYRILSRVPYAIQQVLICRSFSLITFPLPPQEKEKHLQHII